MQDSQDSLQDKPIIFFADTTSWEQWLDQHHADSTGVWLKFARKNSGIASLYYDGALLAALCYGWIDGQSRSYDEQYYLQKFTPRGKKSIWSQRNVGLVAELITAGRMQPAGQAAIDAAKADGRWEQAYAGQAAMTVPPDLAAALEANASAKAFFATLNKTNRYAVLWRIETAKKPATRQKWIERLVVMLADGQKLH